MPKVSIVIPTYRRLENLERILVAWLVQSPDVWLCDSSGKFETNLPINHVRFSPDQGIPARHAISILAQGDYVIKADDDVLPKPGLIEDFLRFTHLDGIFGVMGREFLGDRYYEKTRVYRSREILQPVEAGMLGILTFAPRKYLVFDLQGCTSGTEDLWWHMKAFPKVIKYVIPTKNYKQLPESNDAECHFKNPKIRAERQSFYQKYYRINYEGQKRESP
jgi:glycosyltransferase involved in cell wall biosynthesis